MRLIDYLFLLKVRLDFESIKRQALQNFLMPIHAYIWFQSSLLMISYLFLSMGLTLDILIIKSMGGFFSSMWGKVFKTNRNYNILILGLANAGKTTLLYQMSLGKAVETTPTIGSNVEQITHKNVKFSAWDLGGQQRIRSVWSTYYSRTDAVIFVIDSTDVKSEVIAKTELFKIVINENLKDVPILILANKQDAKGALNEEQISKQYSLHEIKDHSWRLQMCSALEGNGISEALDWLTDELVKKL